MASGRQSETILLALVTSSADTFALLSPVSFHEQEQWIRDSDRVVGLHRGTFAQATPHDELGHLVADVGRCPISLHRVLARERKSSLSIIVGSLPLKASPPNWNLEQMDAHECDEE